MTATAVDTEKMDFSVKLGGGHIVDARDDFNGLDQDYSFEPSLEYEEDPRCVQVSLPPIKIDRGADHDPYEYKITYTVNLVTAELSGLQVAVKLSNKYQEIFPEEEARALLGIVQEKCGQTEGFGDLTLATSSGLSE